MKRTSQKLVCGITAVMLSLLVVPLAGQESARSKQERARLRFQSLHESMQKLQVALTESAPDESRALKVGNKFVQEARIEEHMAEVRQLLSDSRWDEALERMNAVRDKLHSLMNLLLNRDLDVKDLMERIDLLEGFQKRVEELIDEQQAEKEAAARAEALKKHLEELEKAKAEVAQMIANQTALKERANDSGMAADPAAAKEMEAREGELKAAAESLGERAEQLEKESKELAKPEGDGAEAGQSSGASGASAAAACKSAGGKMGQAQEKLGKNQPESSLQDMDKALEKLTDAKSALEAMAEAARRELQSLPFEHQAKEQERTQVATDKLAKDMEQAGEGEEGQPKEETPGTKNVQQAVPKQKAAAGQLKEYKPGKAKQEQQDAKEDLEEAKEDLEDALAQLRQQLQDEVLRALEERFGAMLAKQKELSARTTVTERLRGESLTVDGGLSAALVERCRELSEGEVELASEAGDAMKLLEEEGSTAVFPELVEELHGDFLRVGERLAQQKTAQGTQAMQTEIEENLGMLIDALRRSIEEGSGGGQGQCDQQPPLVPMSAELKLILALQKRVYQRTVKFDEAKPEPGGATEVVDVEAGEIARKQGRVKQLTRKLATKLNKESEVEDQ